MFNFSGLRQFRYRYFGLFLLTVVFLISLQSCKDEEDIINEPENYFKSATVSGNQTLYWGHQQFTRETGKPVNVKKIVGSSDLIYYEPRFTLQVRNGNGTSKRVSSAVIKFNGKQVFGPSDFSGSVDQLSCELTGLTANSILEVELRSTPGSFIECWIDGTIKPGFLKDTRDGKFYKTVKIGNQLWMAENLAYLPFVAPPDSFSTTKPFCYVYGYSGNNVVDAKNSGYYGVNGVLYNWPAAMNNSAASNSIPSGVQGICPDGWHLPSDAEWTVLYDYLRNNGFGYQGVASRTAKSLASNTGWLSYVLSGTPGNNPAVNNSSGFNALPAGLCGSGSFRMMGEIALWITTTLPFPSAPDRVTFTEVYYNTYSPGRILATKLGGASIRCIKD